MCDFYLAGENHQNETLKGKFGEASCSSRTTLSKNHHSRELQQSHRPSTSCARLLLPGGLFKSKLNAVINGALTPILEDPSSGTLHRHVALSRIYLPKYFFHWRLDFSQPVFDYSQFQHRLLVNSIALETAEISTDPCDHSDSLSGVVRVLNRSNEKRVFVRVTADEWESFGEAEATFQASEQHFTENFSFSVPLTGAARVSGLLYRV